MITEMPERLYYLYANNPIAHACLLPYVMGQTPYEAALIDLILALDKRERAGPQAATTPEPAKGKKPLGMGLIVGEMFCLLRKHGMDEGESSRVATEYMRLLMTHHNCM